MGTNETLCIRGVCKCTRGDECCAVHRVRECFGAHGMGSVLVYIGWGVLWCRWGGERFGEYGVGNATVCVELGCFGVDGVGSALV